MNVSIIIINYNTFDLTCKCIESIQEKTSEITYEIILIDNASSECDPDLFLNRFPGVKLIKNERNIGFAGGNNRGIVQALGNIILLLNSDTILLNNSVKIAYNKLISDTGIGVVSAQLLFPDGKVQSCCNRFPSIKLELVELFRLQKLLPPRKRAKLLLGSFFDHATTAQPDWVWGTFFMFKKEILNDLPENKLAEDFFMYGEDMQWCYEIKKRLGYKIYFEPKAKVIHYISSSTNQVKNFDKQKIITRHEYIFLKKYYGNIRAYIIFKLKALKYASLSVLNPEFIPAFKLYINSRNYI